MVSNCDLSSMCSYSPASKCSSALPHQPSRPPRHDQHEISGLLFLFTEKKESLKNIISENSPG
ncbi:MAG: hypothetical protein K9M81_01685 [Chthoniobacterales bacterium]|nr:hypothetical protein [Chthoniobacterales bacterium]